jgi:hypothetical protein
MEKLSRALVAIHNHAPVLDVLAQQQPIAAFVWGSIRFIIKVSNRWRIKGYTNGYFVAAERDER